MSQSAFDWLSAAELSKLFSRGEASPVEVLDAMLNRASSLQHQLNALVLIDEDRAQTLHRLQNPGGATASRCRLWTEFHDDKGHDERQRVAYSLRIAFDG